jgi:hypothetical protein
MQAPVELIFTDEEKEGKGVKVSGILVTIGVTQIHIHSRYMYLCIY